MARRPRKEPPSDAALERVYLRTAMARLGRNLRCDEPDVRGRLSVTQQFALHEFFCGIMSAGYKLYQVVPPEYADPIIKKKFELIFPPEPPK